MPQSSDFQPSEQPSAASSADMVADSSDRPIDPPIVATTQPANPQVVAGAALLLDLALVAGWIVATDWLLFRLGTFLTWGLFFVLAAIVLWSVKILRPQILAGPKTDVRESTAAPNRSRRFSHGLPIAIVLLLLSFKLLWCGSWLQVACGLLGLLTLSMALSGYPAHLPEVLGFAGSVVAGAANRLKRFRFGTLNEATGVVKPILGLAIVLPVLVVLVFSTLFVLANPNLSTSLAGYFRTAWQAASDLLLSFSPFEFAFWIVSGWLLLGMLYPASCRLMNEARAAPPSHAATLPAGLYAAYRNSLLSLIALFTVYLIFEFSTLWFRTFPKNFYYAGYAHQGAFWLTTALALATVVLSYIFRDRHVADPRMKRLKRLAILWSIANLLLAAAVYNRLLIYIDFNGMTRMRAIGFLGITSVVVGFALVVTKIVRERSFVWLVHRQLWVPLLAAVAYAILPVDWLVNSYNARHVLAGDMAPAVQIVAHHSSAEGMLPLLRLVDVDDPPVREGVRALLALWARELGVAQVLPIDRSDKRREYDDGPRSSAHTTPWLGRGVGFSQFDSRGQPNWTNFQIAESRLASELRRRSEVWSKYAADPPQRDAAISAFFQYAYQWY